MRVAIVGCGFVADQYMQSLPRHADLELVGVADRIQAHAERFSAHYRVPTYRSLDSLLADSRIEMVLNLTNPSSHFEVSRACLLSGKHVYSEKPLAMTVDDANALVNLAEQRGLKLAGAPSRLLGETAQTMWKALRDGAIGKPLVAYAEMDDGLVHRMNYKGWIGPSGAMWPYKDEFETGCTLEHAGYAVTWLTAFFGPAESVTTFASVQIPDKETDDPIEVLAPDFSVASIKYRSGVVARLTCSIIVPENHSIRIFGNEGMLHIKDCWKNRETVYLNRRRKFLGRSIALPWPSKVPLLGSPELAQRSRGLKKVDFCLGPLEIVGSLRENRECRLSARFCLHINELVLAIHNALAGGSAIHVKMGTTFSPIDPMPWAR